jgi:hypothetical protein
VRLALVFVFGWGLGEALAEAQPPLPRANPEQAGLSSERLERLSEVLQRDMCCKIKRQRRRWVKDSGLGSWSGNRWVIIPCRDRSGTIPGQARGTYFWVDPQEKLVATLMLQNPFDAAGLGKSSHYRQQLRYLVYQALAAPATAPSH